MARCENPNRRTPLRIPPEWHKTRGMRHGYPHETGMRQVCAGYTPDKKYTPLGNWSLLSCAPSRCPLLGGRDSVDQQVFWPLLGVRRVCARDKIHTKPDLDKAQRDQSREG